MVQFERATANSENCLVLPFVRLIFWQLLRTPHGSVSSQLSDFDLITLGWCRRWSQLSDNEEEEERISQEEEEEERRRRRTRVVVVIGDDGGRRRKGRGGKKGGCALSLV